MASEQEQQGQPTHITGNLHPREVRNSESNNDHLLQKFSQNLILFLSGGETPQKSWINSIFVYPLVVARPQVSNDDVASSEMQTFIVNEQNPSIYAKHLSFDSQKSFPSRDSHSMLFWNNHLVFLAGNVGSFDTRASDVWLLDLEEMYVKLWRFEEGLHRGSSASEDESNATTLKEDVSRHCIVETFSSQTGLPQVRRRLHTATYIGNNRILMVGGIAIEQSPSLMNDAPGGVSLQNQADSPADSFFAHTVFKDAWIFDLEQKMWVQAASAPEYLCGHTAVFDEEAQCVYVFGGANHANEKLNTLYVYYPHKNLWRKLDEIKGAIPTPREQHAACFHTINRQMIIYGGWTAAGPRSDCFAFDVDQLTFYRVGVKKEMARAPRFGHTAECFGSKVIVYGGRDDYFQNLDSFEVMQVWDDEDDFSNVEEGELEQKLRDMTPSHIFFGEEAKNQYFESKNGDEDDDQLTGKPRLTRLSTSAREWSEGEDNQSLLPDGDNHQDNNSDDSPKYASPRLNSPSSRFTPPHRNRHDPAHPQVASPSSAIVNYLPASSTSSNASNSVPQSSQMASQGRRASTDPQDHFADLLESIVYEKESEGSTPRRTGIPPIDVDSHVNRSTASQSLVSSLSPRSADSARARKSVSFSSDHNVKVYNARR